jgi:hypothetical protein
MALFDFIFGCYHSKLSRVFTIEGRTYRVCCGCGAQFDYSLECMTTGPRLRYSLRMYLPQPRNAPVLNPESVHRHHGSEIV